MSAQLKLLKVIVQPVLVIDHGTHLVEVTEPPREIPASAWAAYSGVQFPRELAEAQAALDAKNADAGKNAKQAKSPARKR